MLNHDYSRSHLRQSPSPFAALKQEPVRWEKDPDTGDDVVSIPEVCGGFWWAQLHSWAKNIRDDGCSSCGQFAVEAARAIHDIVNSHLGKPIQHPDSVIFLSRKILDMLDTNPVFGTNVPFHQDEELCELVPTAMTFEASLFHQDPASSE